MAEKPLQGNHAGGIAIITLVIAIGISIGYYQFVYVPQANSKPILPASILEPPESIEVKIVEGSSQPEQTRNFQPKEVRGIMGLSNKIVWISEDSVPHTVTSDDGYIDQISGPFDSLRQQEKVPGGFLREGQSFEFTFTKVGEYLYHCEPHPWMKGKVEIVENFA
jgi:plastocyanin